MATKKRFRNPPVFRAGYSLIELLIVAAIMMVIAALALPTVGSTVLNIQTRSAMSELSSQVQDCRSMAVRKSKMKALHVQIKGGRTVLFTQTAPGDADISHVTVNEDKMLYLPRGMAIMSSGAPAAVDPAVIWGADATIGTGDITFNARGLPCDFSGGSCAAPRGFIQYLIYSPSGGSPRWIALTVSPAGRIKTFLWAGENHWEE